MVRTIWNCPKFHFRCFIVTFKLTLSENLETFSLCGVRAYGSEFRATQSRSHQHVTNKTVIFVARRRSRSREVEFHSIIHNATSPHQPAHTQFALHLSTRTMSAKRVQGNCSKKNMKKHIVIGCLKWFSVFAENDSPNSATNILPANQKPSNKRKGQKTSREAATKTNKSNTEIINFVIEIRSNWGFHAKLSCTYTPVFAVE